MDQTTAGSSAGDRRRMNGLAGLLAVIPHHRGWLRVLTAVNVLGSIYGFNWYVRQLAVTPWYLWPVTPDSPLSSLGFGIYLALRLGGRAAPWFAALVQLATFKYGLWTVVVLGQYVLATGDANPELLLLVATHGGMALEAYLLMRADPAPTPALALALGWLTLNDGFDYLVGTHPTVPNPAVIDLVAVEAVALTWLALAAALAARRRGDPVRYTGQHLEEAGLAGKRGSR
ncbi:MAG TPA: DUF1405 domain-containing protein [Bacillota bacterium]